MKRLTMKRLFLPLCAAVMAGLLPLSQIVLMAAEDDCFDPNDPGETYNCYDSGTSYAQGDPLDCMHGDASQCFRDEYFTNNDHFGDICSPMGPIVYGPPAPGKEDCTQGYIKILVNVTYMEFVCSASGVGGCDLVDEDELALQLDCVGDPHASGDDCSQPTEY